MGILNLLCADVRRIPQLLQRPVALDAARDDDGRGVAQILVREIDLLGGRGALELVDRQRVAVDAASTQAAKCSWGAENFWGLQGSDIACRGRLT